MHGRPLAAVEHPRLEHGGVCRPSHLPAECIDFAHQMPLGGSADGGVARHIADGVGVDGKDCRAASEPRRGQRRLNSGVARTDHGHLIAARFKFHG